MSATLSTLRFVLNHPLNRANRWAALLRLLRWQIGSRLIPGPVAVPFVDSTRLLVSRGMTGATGNVYCGLHEYEDMAFVMHALRAGDLFVDVGANVGSYTVLAAGCAGANCMSFEPIPSTFAHLVDNIRFNALEKLVVARNIGLGDRSRTLRFTGDGDTLNHVATGAEDVHAAVDVSVEPLDAVLPGPVAVLKIDVEGFETEVLNGASLTMQNPSLMAVIMELNGSGRRYGFDDEALHRRMLGLGFSCARYDPATRILTVTPARPLDQGNTLYIRDAVRIRERLETAPSRVVLGRPL